MARRTREGIAETEGSADQEQSTDSAEIGQQAADASASDSVSGGFTIVDRSNENDPLSTIEVVESTPKRGRPPGSTRPRVPKATPSEIAQAAPLMVGLANQAVVTWMGPECAMLQAEANYLTPSVARVMARLPRSAAQAVSVYTDPFIIIVALGLWASRIAKIKDAQAKAKYQPSPQEFARASGESGSEFIPTYDTPAESPIAPTDEPTESQNGRARAANVAIMRTVSPT